MSSHSRKASVNKPEASEPNASKAEMTEEKVNNSKELPIGKAQAKAPTQKAGKKKKIDGAALIGIDVAKEDDFSGWYQQVLLKGDMLDYYDVSGCYILKVCKSRPYNALPS
jgi:prolyl-tRNA synthetase